MMLCPCFFSSVMSAAQFLTVLFVHHETKGQSLEELQRWIVSDNEKAPRTAA